MRIAILGYGQEGHSVEAYFRPRGADITIFDPVTPADLKTQDFSAYDLVFRSPSVPPLGDWTSITQYFFAHSPARIIGVTGTKGKGTTCSLIRDLLTALGRKVWLVGNIGQPALDVLDQIQPDDLVVYELSSFQLWDLQRSPHIAVVLHIEPDHLNVHRDYADYLAAKSNIARHQEPTDTCIYYALNPDSTKLGHTSPGHQIPYPITTNRTQLNQLLDRLAIPGQHNRENAEAALLAVAAELGLTLAEFLAAHAAEITTAFANFQGLPHRLQYLRDFRGVKYYDDNFSTNLSSTQVALAAFPEQPLVLIAGGRDKTDNQDLPDLARLFTATPNLRHLVLIGESGRALAPLLPTELYTLAPNLQSAVSLARQHAEALVAPAVTPIVLMSPAAASFDMFKNVYDRGAKFQNLVNSF